MNKLDYYRRSIDKIDKKIVRLFLLRFKLIEQITKYKKTNKIKIFNKARELQVLKNIEKYSKRHQKFVVMIFKNTIDYSKKFQNNAKTKSS